MPADTIAVRLKAARERVGLSQPQLALRSGVPAPTIRGIEQGRRPNPLARTVAALARALGVSLDELVTGEDGRWNRSIC